MKKFFPQTLLIRFILIITTPVIIAQIIAVFLFYEKHWYNVSYRTANLIISDISLLIDSYENNEVENQEKIKKNLNLIANLEINKKIPIYKKRKTIRKVSEEIEILQNILNHKLQYPSKVYLDKDKKQISIFIQLNNDLLKIVISAKTLINYTANIFALWILIINLFTLTISLIFSKNQIRPILELATAVNKFGSFKNFDQNEDKSFKPSGAAEIKKAGIAFLQMKNKIRKQFIKRTQMLAMISHDLRTPLTRIMLQTEFIEDNEVKLSLKQDINMMTQMLDSYIDFTRGEINEKFIKVDLAKWIKEFLLQNYTKEPIKQIFANNDNSDEFLCLIKELSFKRALSNVINNALKYGSKALINIYKEQNWIVITLEDNGKGIKPHLKDLVFKPFYRVDKSRSLDNSNSNVGLGLSITEEIITDHKGKIILDKGQILGGLLVKIILPVPF